MNLLPMNKITYFNFSMNEITMNILPMNEITFVYFFMNEITFIENE